MVREKDYLRNNLYDLFSQLIGDRSENEPKGYPLIYERQNGTRPKGTFFSLEFKDVIQLGSPKFSYAIWNSMVVFRSNKQIYVQVINDLEGKTHCPHDHYPCRERKTAELNK